MSDARVVGWLGGVVAALRAVGLTALVERTVAQVWERNVERYDPAVAGDTATSLGITSSENIRTLLLRGEPADRAEHDVEITSVQQALVLRCGRRRILLMKAADRRLDRGAPGELDWTGTRWEGESDVRRLAALENAASYAPRVEHQTGQTWWRFGAAGDDPERLRHLVLVWTGDPVTATTAGWLGVPYAGPPRTPPWLAVTGLWHHGPDDVPRPPEPVIAVPRARASPERALRSPR